MKKLVVSFTAAFICASANSLLAADTQVDVGRIIDRATAESVLGAKVKEAAPRNVQTGDGYYSKCNYYSEPPGKTLVLRVYQAGAGHNGQRELDVVTKNTPALKDVSGLGDKALVTDGAASAMPAQTLMLYVLKGNALVTVGLNGFENESALEKAKAVAEKIVARL